MPDDIRKSVKMQSLQQELTKENLVSIDDGNGGTISARLISHAAGTNNYYEDTRNKAGRLVIGKKLDYVE